MTIYIDGFPLFRFATDVDDNGQVQITIKIVTPKNNHIFTTFAILRYCGKENYLYLKALVKKLLDDIYGIEELTILEKIVKVEIVDISDGGIRGKLYQIGNIKFDDWKFHCLPLHTGKLRTGSNIQEN